jgi:hypothetical protein
MKKQILILIIILVSMAMALLIGIQVYWIRNSIQLREVNFRRSVDEAVNLALSKLETIEFARRIQSNDSLNLMLQQELLDPQRESMNIRNIPGNDTGIAIIRQESRSTGLLDSSPGRFPVPRKYSVPERMEPRLWQVPPHSKMNGSNPM